MHPKISIVTPSYSQGNFLEQTIQSVLNQDYPNLEYIVIDGGSTDNSVDIIKKYENKIAYWVSEKDKGQSGAINKGFQHATGDILHWLNSDDLLVPGALFSIADFFSTHPEVDCVIGDLEVIDAQGRVLFMKKAIPFHYSSALYTAALVPQPSTFFTRKAWQKTGALDVSLQYTMDFDFFLRMAQQGIKFDILKKPAAKFRLHKDSKTVSGYTKHVWSENRKIQERYLPAYFKNLFFKEQYLTFLTWLYRARGYVTRAVLRGDVVPLKATIARNRV